MEDITEVAEVNSVARELVAEAVAEVVAVNGKVLLISNVLSDSVPLVDSARSRIPLSLSQYKLPLIKPVRVPTSAGREVFNAATFWVPEIVAVNKETGTKLP
jgi:hypothetical protein